MTNADDKKVDALTDNETLTSDEGAVEPSTGDPTIVGDKAGGVGDGSTADGSSEPIDEPEVDGADPEPVVPTGSGSSKRSSRAGEGLPIKMLHDRILVQLEGPDGDRKSSGGILIPATAQVGKRLTWAEIVAAGPSVRSMELGDRVLFNPEDRYEVEVGGKDYIILRERDIHAVAAERLDDSPMGLYL